MKNLTLGEKIERRRAQRGLPAQAKIKTANLIRPCEHRGLMERVKAIKETPEFKRDIETLRKMGFNV